MTFKQLITICKPITVSGPELGEIGALRQDSRAVETGDVFIAIEGTQVDGHAFIEDAIKNGASVVISERLAPPQTSATFIQVKNTRALLGPLAQAFAGQPAKKLRVIGITGTNGKTTVATLTYQVLQTLGARPSLLGTVAKWIGNEKQDSRLTTADPIELAADMQQMVDSNSGYLVMEVSSHALDQQRVNGISFEVGAFTNLSHDHLDYHKNVEAYAKAKKRLFDSLNEEATAVINADDSQAALMAQNCEATILNFGFTADQSIACKIIESIGEGLTLDIDGVEVSSPLAGRFNAYNVAQTFLICRALGLNKQAVVRALSSAEGAPGRLQRVQLKDQPNQPLVFVDYAHTPGALENVLQALRDIKKSDQTLVVVFGCGGDRDKTKRPKMAGIAERWADRVYITSDNPRGEAPDAIIDDAMSGFESPDHVTRITDRGEAIRQAIRQADENAMILIAGKGHETYQEVKGKRHHFDDREIAREALSKRNGNPQTSEVR